jgi:hypothetical protein
MSLADADARCARRHRSSSMLRSGVVKTSIPARLLDILMALDVAAFDVRGRNRRRSRPACARAAHRDPSRERPGRGTRGVAGGSRPRSGLGLNARRARRRRPPRRHLPRRPAAWSMAVFPTQVAPRKILTSRDLPGLLEKRLRRRPTLLFSHFVHRRVRVPSRYHGCSPWLHLLRSNQA